MIIQLNPCLPVYVVERGTGYAFALIDYSQEHHLHFVVAMDSDGSIWTISNTQVRIQKNISLNRLIEGDIKVPPFKSKAQIGKLAVLEKEGKVKKGTVKEFAKATPNIKKLPEQVKKKK